MDIGILGGTFDPIHIGHLALADAAFRQLKLDRMIFVPAFLPPLPEKGKGLAPAPLRLEMVRQTISENPNYEVSDLEIRRQGISYTVDTLREMGRSYPDPNRLYFITGGDWGRSLDRWKDIGTILSLCQFVVAKRPGYEKLQLPPQVRFLDFQPLDISSTQVRDMIRAGKSVDAWMPKPALAIIKQHSLYQMS